MSWKDVGSWHFDCKKAKFEFTATFKTFIHIKLFVEDTSEIKLGTELKGLAVEVTEGHKSGEEIATGEEQEYTYKAEWEKGEGYEREYYIYQETVTFKKFEGGEPTLVGEHSFPLKHFWEVSCDKKCC